MMARADARSLRPIRPVDRDSRTMLIPASTLEALARPARVRGLTVNALIRDLLDEIAEANLVDAVLDDIEATTMQASQ